jgi:hypothetical protein
MINLIRRRWTKTVHCESHVYWKDDHTEHGLGQDERRDFHVREITTGVNDFAVGKTSILNVDTNVNKFMAASTSIVLIIAASVWCLPVCIPVTSNFLSTGTVDRR